MTNPLLRTRAAELLEFAGKDYLGRRQYDPIFEAVTEGRQSPRYSSCADLGHWLLYRLGFRDDWINRAEFVGWVDEVNLSRLTAKAAGGSNPSARRPRPGDLVLPGDVLVVNVQDPKRSHVMVAYGNGTTGAGTELVAGAHLKTCEYGQWNSSFARPSGKLSCHIVDVLAGKVLIGVSPLDSILDLDDLDPPDPSLADIAADYAGTVTTAMRALSLIPLPRMRGHDVQWWAEELKRSGLTPGIPIDVFGPMCDRATTQWQNSQGLPVGPVDQDDWLWMVNRG